MLQIGKLPTHNDVGKRDAGHIACVAVTAEDNMQPGDSFMFTDTTFTRVAKCVPSIRHGVIDPFTKANGSVMLALVDPKFITGLTHNYNLDIEETDCYCDRWQEAQDYDEDDDMGIFSCSC